MAPAVCGFEVRLCCVDFAVWMFSSCCDCPVDQSTDSPSEDAWFQFGFVEPRVDRCVAPLKNEALVVCEAVFWDDASVVVNSVLVDDVHRCYQDAGYL